MRRPILLISNGGEVSSSSEQLAKKLSEDMDFELQVKSVDLKGKSGELDFNIDQIDGYVEEKDVAMLVIDLHSNAEIQRYLNKLRDLRVPYIFVKDGQTIDLSRVAVPVTFLEEDREKAPFAASLARFMKSHILLYKPNDYGTKAQRNIDSFVTLFSKLEGIDYEIKDSKKRSDGVELQASKDAKKDAVGMVIVSASRDYGLDDLLFGPKERKIVASAEVPIMIINPRADLYALCD